MKQNVSLRNAVEETGDAIYMVYDVEALDEPPTNWLHEGLSHACSQVWRYSAGDVLRPLRTKCGIMVSTRLDRKTAPLFNLVCVETTCLWCMGERRRE